MIPARKLQRYQIQVVLRKGEQYRCVSEKNKRVSVNSGLLILELLFLFQLLTIHSILQRQVMVCVIYQESCLKSSLTEFTCEGGLY